MCKVRFEKVGDQGSLRVIFSDGAVFYARCPPVELYDPIGAMICLAQFTAKQLATLSSKELFNLAQA